ncbi:hypothetical protein AAGC94_12205 [Clostridium sporogenes]|uniref:hypothetical protein n=1 Tax=Clostridium TaxID=1485 RepID=UPI0018AB8D9B|nr:hypothetical protein [Clostridium tepidum]
MATKRINLSFSMDREEDIKAYDILSEQKYKTDYVIRAVLRFQEKEESLTKEGIKKAVKEALIEYGGIPKVNNDNEDLDRSKNQLPDSIFDMFNNL